MRAAILNGTPETLNANGESGESVSALLETTTNDPALWGSEALGPSTREPRFNADKLIGWVETGAKVQAAGKIATGGINFGAMAAQMASGAAAGAAIAGVGAVLGAVVGAIIYLANNWNTVFSQVPPAWQGAGEGVHDWFTQYGPQEFLDWVRDTRPALLQTSPGDLARALCVFWLERYGYVVTDAPGRAFYSGIPDSTYYAQAGGMPAMLAIYTPMGVDYPKTRLEAHPAGFTSAGQTSQGLGGVWQLNRKVYAPPRRGGVVTVSKPEQAGSGMGWILGLGAAVAAAVAASAANRKTRR